MRLTIVILALAVGACAGPPAYNLDNGGILPNPYPRLPTGTITGTVRDGTTNSPLAGVSVFLANIDPPVESSTDAKGEFILFNSPQGKQIVVVRKPGCVWMVDSTKPMTKAGPYTGVIADVMPNTTVSLGLIEMKAGPPTPTPSSDPSPVASDGPKNPE